jgi:hypothetical protein
MISFAIWIGILAGSALLLIAEMVRDFRGGRR